MSTIHNVTNPRRGVRRITAALLALALLASCNGDDDDNGNGSDGTSAATTETGTEGTVAVPVVSRGCEGGGPCFSAPQSSGQPAPEADGIVGANEWSGSVEVALKSADGGTNALVTFQAIVADGALHILVEASGSTGFHPSDAVMFLIDPKNNKSADRTDDLRIIVNPVDGSGHLDDAGQGVAPREVHQYGYDSDNSAWVQKSLDSWLNGAFGVQTDAVQSGELAGVWKLETRIPLETIGADGSPIGLYVNVLYASANRYWPWELPPNAQGLPFEAGDPDPDEWGEVSLAVGACHGLSLHAGELWVYPYGGLIATNQDNYFYANVYNSTLDPIAGNLRSAQADVEFQFFNFGASKEWKTIPTDSPNPVSLTVPPGSITAAVGAYKPVEFGGAFLQATCVAAFLTSDDAPVLKPAASRNFSIGTVGSSFVSEPAVIDAQGLENPRVLLRTSGYNTELGEPWTTATLSGAGGEDDPRLDQISETEYLLDLADIEQFELVTEIEPPPETVVQAHFVPHVEGYVETIDVDAGDLVTIVSPSAGLTGSWQGDLSSTDFTFGTPTTLKVPDGADALDVFVEPGFLGLEPDVETTTSLADDVIEQRFELADQLNGTGGNVTEVAEAREQSIAELRAEIDATLIEVVSTPVLPEFAIRNSIVARDVDPENPLPMPLGANLPTFSVCVYEYVGEPYESNGETVEPVELVGCFGYLIKSTTG